MSAADASPTLAETTPKATRVNAQAGALRNRMPLGRGKDMRWRERSIESRILASSGPGSRENHERPILFPATHKNRECPRFRAISPHGPNPPDFIENGSRTT